MRKILTREISKISKYISSSLIVLLLVLVPVLQTSSNLIQIPTASATGGITLNSNQTTSGSIKLIPYQITLSNFNVGTGSNRALVVGVEASSNPVTSITFGGISLTRAVHSFHNNVAELWYLTNPNGTGNIVVTMKGPTSVVVGAYSFFGVDQANPTPTNAANYDTCSPSCTSPTISITTANSNSWVIDSPSIYGGVTLSSPTCTQRWNLNVQDTITGKITGASSTTVQASPGSVTCSWTASSADFWDDVAVELKASGATTPSAPTNPTSTALNTTTVQLGWIASSNNGGSPITGYKIQRASTSWVTVANNTGNVTSYTIGLLAPNSVQTYRIGAWNSIGLGAWSTNDTSTTVPGSPTSLTATGVSSSQINLSWTAPSGNATISGYKIERSTDEGSTWSTLVSNTGSSATTYSDTGLSQGTSYTYRVSAINSGGTSSPSNTASPPQWFDIFATPSSLTIQRNSSGTSTITLYGTYGFNNNVNLSLLSPPKGISGSFSPSQVLVPTTGQVTSTLTININSSATISTQNITVLGQSGSVTNETSISLTITNSPSSSWHPSTGVLVPLYCGPYLNDSTPCNSFHSFRWQDIVNNATKYTHVPFFVIVNPDSGPGNGTAPNCAPDNQQHDYNRGISSLANAGVIVLGYVHTSYATGSVPYSTARYWVDQWASCYKQSGLKGILLDEMSNNATPGSLTYYGNLTNYIHQNFTYSIGNPGQETLPQFLTNKTIDRMNIYEGSNSSLNSCGNINKLDNATLQGFNITSTSCTPSQDNTGYPIDSWHTQYNKGNFSYIEFGQPSITEKQVQELTDWGGLLDITNGTLPNPYDHIQPYLNSLLSYLNNNSTSLYIQSFNGSNNNATITGFNQIVYQGPAVSNYTLVRSQTATPFSYNATQGWPYTINATSIAVHSGNCMKPHNWVYNGINYSNPITITAPSGTADLNVYYRATNTHC